MNSAKAREAGTIRRVVWLGGILCFALGVVTCAQDETVNPLDPTAALANSASSKGWWHWKQTLWISPDSATISETADTVRLTAILTSSWNRGDAPTIVKADWFLLDPEIVAIEGPTNSTATVLLRGREPGMARIVTIYDGLAAIARVWVEQGDTTAPVPVAAAVSGSPQPVLLVGDTVTMRPNLIDEDSVVIATEPSEWSADFDSAFVSISEDFLVTALALTPPGSTTVIVLTHTDTELAAEVAVTILPDGDPEVPVAAVVSESQPVLLVGDTVTVRPNLIDDDSVVIPTEPSEWSTDFDPAIVSVSEDFLLTALAPTPPGSTSIVSLTHTDTELATEVGIVILPDEDPGEWPDNEPPGMTQVVAVDGSTKSWPGFNQYNGWNDDNRVAIVDDPDSKHGKAMEKRFFIGDEGGWHGITSAGSFGSFEELYIRIVFRLSSNWQWHRSGGKYFYYGAAGREQFVGPTQFVMGWNPSGTPFWLSDGDGRFTPNGVPPTTRGVYHTIELHHIASTSGANGSLRMWVDGIEVQDFTKTNGEVRTLELVNQEWSSTRDMDNKRLSGMQAFLFWGGQNDTKRVNDWIRLSELYISGKN